MQVNRRFPYANDEQQEKVYAATHASARTSVWVDPVERHNVSASYIEREQVGQKRRKEEVSNSIRPIPPIPPITPIPPISSARIPRRASAHIFNQSGSLRARSLHPESTVSRAKNASLSPHSAIDELDTVPPALSIARVEQAIDEIDTILPISPSIDEIDTIPVIQRQRGKSVVHTDKHSAISCKQNEVDIDEIDTLIPRAPIAKPPKPVRQAQAVHAIYAEQNVTPDNKMLSGVQMSPVSREVSWTAGQGANSELAKRIASRARDKQEKSFGELMLIPLNTLRWWLLYPGRMEFMLWISGALILLCVTCTLLFATLASSGIIRFAGADTSTGKHNVIHNAGSSLPCAASSPRCHDTKTTSATSTTNRQGGSSTLQATKTTSIPGTAPTTSTPGASASPISGSSGTSTPISQTPPVSVSPTVDTSPTVEPTQTPPTPTATVKPSPTAVITPTVGVTPPKPTPTSGHHTDAQTLSLGTAFAGNNSSQEATANTWMWLALVGYALSMGMLGLAALLYRRKRRVS